MRLLFTASVFLTLGCMCPVSVSLSTLPEDLEGSGYDMDGLGSGDESEPVSSSETKNLKEELVNRNGEGNRSKNTLRDSPGSSDLSKRDATSDEVIFSNGKSFMQNKEVLAGIIAGGVLGAILGVTLSAILIYKWKKKNEKKRLFKEHQPLHQALF